MDSVVIMRFYKTTENGYIYLIGVGNGGTEITEEEYGTILEAINNKPQATDTKDYLLKEDLTWEEYEVEPVEDEPTAEEIVNILTGEEE